MKNLRTLIIVILTVIVFIFNSCKEDVLIPRFCSGAPVLPFNVVKLTLTTDIVSEREVTIDGSGFLHGENFEIQRNGIRKSANISGYICDDLGVTAEIIFNDTANTSKLRFAGYYTSGALYYTPNTASDTSYTSIGGYNGFIQGNHGYGQFTTPLFSGDYSYLYLSR